MTLTLNKGFWTPSVANTHCVQVLNASSQYLSAADSASLSVTGNATWEFWIKFASSGGGADRLIFYKSTTANQFSYAARVNPGLTQTSMQLSSNGTSVSDAVWTGLSLSTGTWYHFAYVYTAAAGEVEFFLDGSSQGVKTGYPTSLFNGNSTLGIGATDAGTDGFDGKLDDYRIWSAARTSTEINNNKNLELTGSESNLNAYWKLNNVLTDSTSNGNTLTNNNSATFQLDTPF